MAGAAGFDNGPQLALGSVFGVRQWQYDSSGRLAGAHGMTWSDGENVATCQKGHTAPHSFTAERRKEMEARQAVVRTLLSRPEVSGVMAVPALEQGLSRAELHLELDTLASQLKDGQDCACGMWAYWKLDPHEFSMGEKPVAGIIEGYGKTIIGTRGFRCQKARIVALHCAYEYVRPLPPKVKDGPGKLDPGWHSVFTSDYERGTADAVARLARDEDALGQAYPGAKVYASMDAMLKAHPPTKDYA